MSTYFLSSGHPHEEIIECFNKLTLKSEIRHSKDVEFETPEFFFKKACSLFNIFPQLDICATQQNTKCKRFYTKQQDAFYFEWKEDLWANIPFAKEDEKLHMRGVRSWVQRIYAQHKKHDISAIVLLPLAAPVISNYSKYCEVWVLPKRMRFKKNGRTEKFVISRDLMFLVFRSKQNIIDTYHSAEKPRLIQTLKGGVFEA